jgi:hypothetical protein
MRHNRDTWVFLISTNEYRPASDIKQIIRNGDRVFALFEDDTHEIKPYFLNDYELEIELKVKTLSGGQK